MATVNIIGLYEPKRISFAQSVIPNPAKRKFIAVYFLYEGSTITAIGAIDQKSYVPIHIPMEAIANAVKIGEVSVSSPNGSKHSIDKFNFTLNTDEECYIFQHLISNKHTDTKHELKILDSGRIRDFITANNTITLSAPTTGYELNGTDTKPPCQKSIILNP